MMKNSKAQSQIITTVLIILLVLAAIVIVWQVVRRTIDESTTQVTGATECINIDLDIDDVDENSVKVSRGSQGGTIAGVRILVKGITQDADTATEGHQDFNALEPLESKTYTVETIDSGDKVEVAAVLEGGAVCSATGEATA